MAWLLRLDGHSLVCKSFSSPLSISVLSAASFSSRGNQGDRLRPHPDVHAAQEHRGQAEAVFEVRSPPPALKRRCDSGFRKWCDVAGLAVSSAGFPVARQPPQPIAHHSPALCSLLEHGLAGHLLCQALVNQRVQVPALVAPAPPEGSALCCCVSPLTLSLSG